MHQFSNVNAIVSLFDLPQQAFIYSHIRVLTCFKFSANTLFGTPNALSDVLVAHLRVFILFYPGYFLNIVEVSRFSFHTQSVSFCSGHFFVLLSLMVNFYVIQVASNLQGHKPIISNEFWVFLLNNVVVVVVVWICVGISLFVCLLFCSKAINWCKKVANVLTPTVAHIRFTMFVTT